MNKDTLQKGKYIKDDRSKRHLYGHIGNVKVLMNPDSCVIDTVILHEALKQAKLE